MGGQLNDLRHEFYTRQTAVGGTLDNDQELFEWFDASFNMDIQTLASLGFTYTMGDGVTIPATTPYSFGFLSNLLLPTTQLSTLLNIIGARDLLIETFLGGTISGGSAMTQFPTNVDNPQGAPNQAADSGVTIDVPGVLIQSKNIIGTGQGTDEELQAGGLIVPLDVTNYVTLTNNDAASVDIEISFLMSVQPGDPS